MLQQLEMDNLALRQAVYKQRRVILDAEVGASTEDEENGDDDDEDDEAADVAAVDGAETVAQTDDPAAVRAGQTKTNGVWRVFSSVFGRVISDSLAARNQDRGAGAEPISPSTQAPSTVQGTTPTAGLQAADQIPSMVVDGFRLNSSMSNSLYAPSEYRPARAKTNLRAKLIAEAECFFPAANASLR